MGFLAKVAESGTGFICSESMDEAGTGGEAVLVYRNCYAA